MYVVRSADFTVPPPLGVCGQRMALRGSVGPGFDYVVLRTRGSVAGSVAPRMTGFGVAAIIAR